jgi:hypothetical protein
MKLSPIFAIAIVGSALAATPAFAQSAQEQARFDQAQARYDREYQLYREAVDRYRAARAGASAYGQDPAYPPAYSRDPYVASPSRDPYAEGNIRDPYSNGGRRVAPDIYANGGVTASTYADDRDEGDYDPSRYYRPGRETVLGANDRVYAGQNGQYYCRRSDGTTGLIVGAAGGGILGNVIDGGHSRTVGTLLGAAIGGLAGRAIDQSNSQIRCR